jgi:hypothetical protein
VYALILKSLHARACRDRFDLLDLANDLERPSAILGHRFGLGKSG